MHASFGNNLRKFIDPSVLHSLSKIENLKHEIDILRNEEDDSSNFKLRLNDMENFLKEAYEELSNSASEASNIIKINKKQTA